METVLSLIALNLVDGECVEDMDRLESDEGFCRRGEVQDCVRNYGMVITNAKSL